MDNNLSLQIIIFQFHEQKLRKYSLESPSPVMKCKITFPEYGKLSSKENFTQTFFLGIHEPTETTVAVSF
jgi:hypothetical protein